MQELSSIFIKPNLAFCSVRLLVRLSPSWIKEGCLSVKDVYAAPELFSFLSLQKDSGQQIFKFFSLKEFHHYYFYLLFTSMLN